MNARREEVRRRDRQQLGRLERELGQMRDEKPAPVTEHRIVPKSKDVHDPDDSTTAWVCVGCREVFPFADDAEDSKCPALELFA